MMKDWFIKVTCFFLTALLLFPMKASSSNAPGEIRIIPRYLEEFVADSERVFHIRLTLLSDHDDLSARLTALQEESKQELEPLIKAYMHAAGILTASASQKTSSMPSELRRVQQDFHMADAQIAQLLDIYKARIDTILQNATLAIKDRTYPSAPLGFSGLQSGKYRLYVVARHASSVFQWFEPYDLKGGEAGAIILSRENLHTPYWTNLNWWSFMNLDFSKHHPEAMPAPDM